MRVAVSGWVLTTARPGRGDIDLAIPSRLADLFTNEQAPVVIITIHEILMALRCNAMTQVRPVNVLLLRCNGAGNRLNSGVAVDISGPIGLAPSLDHCSNSLPAHTTLGAKVTLCTTGVTEYRDVLDLVDLILARPV
jgi:hypothetical protein